VTTTRVFLDDDKDLVPPERARWMVTTELDAQGLVVRERWDELDPAQTTPAAPVVPVVVPSAPAATPSGTGPQALFVAGLALLTAATALAVLDGPAAAAAALLVVGVALVVFGR